MKYTTQMPSTDKQLSIQLLSDGWKKIKEPHNLMISVLLSLPFLFVLGGMTLIFAYLLEPKLFSFITSESLRISIRMDIRMLLFLISIFVYMFFHELIHAVFIPNFTKSNKTYWGVNCLCGFVFTTEPILKSRFLIITVMPFFLLSLVSLGLFYISGFLNWYTIGLAFINAIGSCVDFLNLFLITFQVKSGKTIINNGFETYYK